MRFLILCLCLCASLGLEAIHKPSFDAVIGGSYRQDALNWNIAGLDNHPNILSELAWHDLRIAQVQGYFKFTPPISSFYVRANGSYGQIYQGYVQDSDYDGDDRTLEYSRSISKADKGEVFDLSAGLGWQFSLLCGMFKFAPVAGVSHQEQHLRMYDGDQIINTISDFLGPFDGLHSNYRAKWTGPWVGVDLEFNPLSSLRFFATSEWHWAQYHGTGHWNLREDFISDFKHDANGYGILSALGMKYEFVKNWSLVLLGQYQTMRTQHGSDKTFFEIEIIDPVLGPIGTLPLVGETRLNEVNWHTFAATAAISYHF